MEVADSVYYDTSSPTFLRWKVEVRAGKDWNRVLARPGDVAGGTAGLYPKVAINGKRHYCHHVVWILLKGPIPADSDIDHEDGNPQNNHIDNLRPVPHAKNMRNQRRKKLPDSGVIGVRYHTIVRANKTDEYWVAKWKELDGRDGGKMFNIEKYGNEVAHKLAVEARQAAIERLNSQGAGYTVEHGGAK